MISGVTNRRMMFEVFESSAKRSYENLSEDLTLDFSEALPKSYLLEAAADIEELKNKLRLTAFNKGKLTLTHTEDETLDVIDYKDQTYFIDTFDKRFLLIHTLEKTDKSDDFVKRLIKSDFTFDSAWFPVEFMEKFFELTDKVESWKALYDPDPFESHELEEVDERVSVTYSRYDSLEKYRENKRVNFFEDLPLDSVELRKQGENGISKTTVTSEGKFTNRGNSFQGHLDIVTSVRNEYRNYITSIENECGFQFYNDNGKIKLSGKPIEITLNRKDVDIEKFIDKVFSCSEPFKLFGMSKKISENYYKVEAVDLHVGAQMNFEISRDFLRIYLPKSSCGNTVARIIKSLQHSFDPNLKYKLL